MDKMFPYYLAIGMTAEEYWYGDPLLCRAYHEAFDMKMDIQNQLMWTQGFYVHNAVSASISQAFNKKASDRMKYMEEPIDRHPERTRAERERKQREALANYLNSLAKSFNKGKANAESR